MFVNRKEELAFLEEHYRSGRAELFVVYGRRRVGKTELLRVFCQDKAHVFFIATTASDESQLARFSEQILAFQGLSSTGLVFPSWDSAFEQMAALPGRPVVVLDEFTYLTGGNQAIPSILQKVWDTTLKRSNIFLILCGSYVGMMEREVLSYGAPLYGRRTGSWRLDPLDLVAAAQFVPAYDTIQALETWAILGGIPYYLETFDDRQPVLDNVQNHILHPRSLLYDEPRLLLMEELREPRNYFSILQAIAHGRTRRNEIGQAAHLPLSSVGKYLDVLRSLGIVERQVPITETRPEKSRKGIYGIQDPFLRFWFRFVHPFRDRLELGYVDAILAEKVRLQLDQFVAKAFEQAAQWFISRQAQQGRLPMTPTRVGRWWSPQGEIDLVALDDRNKELLVGECKWTKRPVGINVLEELKRKASLLPGGPWQRIVYTLFAKQGFTAALQALAADEENILLFTPSDLLAGC
ncbi:MAG: ATP-binding protein [Chloroflexi bacterium]|nr:ATP-binding protein [Chloroflexota bacterium]